MLRVLRAAVALLLRGWALPLGAEHEATWQADGLGLPTLAPLPPALDRLKLVAVCTPRGCHGAARELNGTLSRRSAWCAVDVVEFLPRLVEPLVRRLMPSALPQPHAPEAGGCVARLEQRGYNDDTAGPYQLKGAAVLGYRVTAAW